MKRLPKKPEVRKSESPVQKDSFGEDSLESKVERPKSKEENTSAPDSYADDAPQSELIKSETATTLLSTGENKQQRKIEHPTSEIKPMEVHHHPEVEKKGLKEYLLEGLMIFIAVMMGFFAESLREHMADKNWETAYMKSMVQDLK